MSKIINATCENNVVSSEGVNIPETFIFTEGKASSEGILIIDNERKYYLAKSKDDLKNNLIKLAASLDKVVDSITKVSNLFTTIGAGMTGPTTAPPPTLATDVTALLQVGTDLNTINNEIKALKDNLK